MKKKIEKALWRLSCFSEYAQMQSHTRYSKAKRTLKIKSSSCNNGVPRGVMVKSLCTLWRQHTRVKTIVSTNSLVDTMINTNNLQRSFNLLLFKKLKYKLLELPILSKFQHQCQGFYQKVSAAGGNNCMA